MNRFDKLAAMKQKIPQSFIQEVIARTDIISLIGARIELKRRGDNASACCPFHNEKTPSFSVSQSKQFYYCFGCGAHGNAISFLMAYDRLPFIEAVTTLSEQLGMTLPTEVDTGPHEDFSSLYKILEQSKKAFQKKLAESPQAIDYLKSRGLTGETARDFAIGYAPNDWTFLHDSLGTDQTHQIALHTTGMTIEKGLKRYYDRFRDRIMFPIRDVRGRTIAFGGRVLKDGTPKYLNSPETPIFHKSKTLYGLYEAYQQHRQLEKILVVEGYLDVISLAQHGIHYAVATLGTAFNIQHTQLLARYTSDIIFCFDGDNAGKNAAWKALIISLPLMRDGLNIRFLFLDNNEDPDSLVQKIGPQAFEEKIKSASPLSEVFFSHLQSQHPIDSIAGKAAFAKSAVDYLNTMPDGLFKNLLFDQLAKMLDVARSELTTLAQAKPIMIPIEEKLPVEESPPLQLPSVGKRLTHAQFAIQLLLQDPQLAKTIDHIAHLQNTKHLPEHQLLLDIIERAHQNPALSMGALLTHYDNHTQQYLSKIASLPVVIPKTGMAQELRDTLARLQEQHRKTQLSALIEKAKRVELDHEEKQLLQLLLAAKQTHSIE